MLRLVRSVGAYPRLEARLAAIHLGDRAVAEEDREERTGCDECGDKDAMYDKPCSERDDETDDEGECSCSDNDTKYGESDCGCDQ